MPSQQTGDYEKKFPTKEQMEAAFKYNGTIVKFLTRIINNEHDAEDISSDQYEKLKNVGYNYHSLDPNEDIRRHLFSCAKNAAIDFLRKRKRNQEFKSGLGEEFLVDEQQITTEKEKHELMAILDVAIKELPPDMQYIIDKWYMEGRDMKDIADDLKLKLRNAYKKKNSAIKRLKNRLRDLLGFR